MLHEVAAPSGYAVTTDITFTIVNGQVTGNVGVSTDSNTVTMVDDMIVTTTTTTTVVTTTTTAADTTTVATDSPKTGDNGMGMAIAMIAMAATAAFALRRREEV